MVMEINRVSGAKAIIETSVRDVNIMRSNVFDVRALDIKLMSVQTPL